MILILYLNNIFKNIYFMEYTVKLNVINLMGLCYVDLKIVQNWSLLASCLFVIQAVRLSMLLWRGRMACSDNWLKTDFQKIEAEDLDAHIPNKKRRKKQVCGVYPKMNAIFQLGRNKKRINFVGYIIMTFSK
jgi:hypothetical protein